MPELSACLVGWVPMPEMFLSGDGEGFSGPRAVSDREMVGCVGSKIVIYGAL